jgi:hypothetical protein
MPMRVGPAQSLARKRVPTTKLELRVDFRLDSPMAMGTIVVVL